MNRPTKLYDRVMARLREKRVPQRLVAEKSGVPFSTLTKIAQGQVTEPSVHTVQRIADFFEAWDALGGAALAPPPSATPKVSFDGTPAIAKEAA